MKWFIRMNRALAVYGFLVAWFEDASRDGKLTAQEIAEGVAGLVDELGYGDRLTVEPYDPLNPLER